MRQLQNYIVPYYAHHWKEIGIGLGLQWERLEIIEADHCKSENRCIEMLYSWLQIKNNDATWKELLLVLDSPALNNFQSQLSQNGW